MPLIDSIPIINNNSPTSPKLIINLGLVLRFRRVFTILLLYGIRSRVQRPASRDNSLRVIHAIHLPGVSICRTTLFQPWMTRPTKPPPGRRLCPSTIGLCQAMPCAGGHSVTSTHINAVASVSGVYLQRAGLLPPRQYELFTQPSFYALTDTLSVRDGKP